MEHSIHSFVNILKMVWVVTTEFGIVVGKGQNYKLSVIAWYTSAVRLIWPYACLVLLIILLKVCDIAGYFGYKPSLYLPLMYV